MNTRQAALTLGIAGAATISALYVRESLRTEPDTIRQDIAELNECVTNPQRLVVNYGEVMCGDIAVIMSDTDESRHGVAFDPDATINKLEDELQDAERFDMSDLQFLGMIVTTSGAVTALILNSYNRETTKPARSRRP
jgi:hypothetical protein